MNESLTPQEVVALKREILSSLHCAMPGIVEAFDSETQTASVRPALKRKGIVLPIVRDVPVFFPGNRSGAVTWPVSAGDECLLVFADFDIDRWFETGEAEEPLSARSHGLSDAFAFVGFRSRPNVLLRFPSDPSFFGGGGGGGGGVQIDDTAGEGDTGVAFSADKITRELAGKSDVGHDHDDRYAGISHTHDGRYYTETETDALLTGKSDTGHSHAAGDITSGTLALGRGGSGQTGTGSTTTAADIATAESGVSVTTAQYAWWGKVAMVRLVVRKTAAVSSGTTSLCTLAAGKRPKFNTGAVCLTSGLIAQVLSSGRVQVTGSISAGASLTILSTYVLA